MSWATARLTLRLRLPGTVSASVGLIGALAITGASAVTAGEEEDGILAVVLAHLIRRSRLIVSKATAIGAAVLIIALSTWIGLLVGVALGGGGIAIAHMAALAVQLAFFGFATGAVAIALGAGNGRRSTATGVAAAVAIAGWLINSFAPLLSAIAWLKYSRCSITTPAMTRSPEASTFRAS
jgi:ABC-2 type transport system permease protein